jgi:hypothetical protein
VEHHVLVTSPFALYVEYLQFPSCLFHLDVVRGPIIEWPRTIVLGEAQFTSPPVGRAEGELSVTHKGQIRLNSLGNVGVSTNRDCEPGGSEVATHHQTILA